MCNIVFLYNYTVYILYEKSGDGYVFYCISKQAEIDVQSTSNRKLPNFYEKVTDFLLESYRISKWWQNHVFTETCCICHKWRILAYWMMRLFMQMDWLFMQNLFVLFVFYIYLSSSYNKVVYCTMTFWGMQTSPLALRGVRGGR